MPPIPHPKQATAVRGVPAASLQAQPTAPRFNRLLAGLPEADWLRLRPLLEPIVMPVGHVIFESGDIVTHGIFPTTAIVSLLYVTASGSSSQVAAVGHEGMVGIPLFMGGNSTPGRAVVQIGGGAFRISGRAIREEFARVGPFMKLMLHYTQALLAQMTLTAVCNRHHSVDQRLCRWLLLNLDRLSGNELTVTQEMIAHMLGVRREGVTEAAGALQRDHLISYRRGHITVLDRAGLERRSCECYAVVKLEYDRLLADGKQP